MKVIGKGAVHIYPAADECPHAPGDDEQWQESFVIFVWDMEKQVYVFLRLGQEPNRGTGYTAVWLNAWTPEHVFHHTDIFVPMVAGDRTATSLTSGGGLCRYEFNGTHNWSVNAPDVKLELSLKDDHPGFGYWPDGAGSLVKETARNHIEGTGWTTGTLTLKGKNYKIAGTGWRDHSWGKRNWNGILTHRGIGAMFGKDFNFMGINFIGADGKKVKFGSVTRGDTIRAVDDFRVVAYVDEDGISNLGGKVLVNFAGETHVLDFDMLAKGSISLHQSFACVDTMCKVTDGDRVGVGFFETTHNAMGGRSKPNVFADSTGILDSGIYPAGF